MSTAGYEQDFYRWTRHQADLIRNGRLEALDLEHIAEELEDMGISSKRDLVNRLGVLLAHLLKWRYQPQQRSSSWTGTIKEQRRKLLRLLQQNPCLRNEPAERLEDAYGDALAQVERDTGLDESHFSEACPFTPEQALDQGFWPD